MVRSQTSRRSSSPYSLYQKLSHPLALAFVMNEYSGIDVMMMTLISG